MIFLYSNVALGFWSNIVQSGDSQRSVYRRLCGYFAVILIPFPVYDVKQYHKLRDLSVLTGPRRFPLPGWSGRIVSVLDTDPGV